MYAHRGGRRLGQRRVFVQEVAGVWRRRQKKRGRPVLFAIQLGGKCKGTSYRSLAFLEMRSRAEDYYRRGLEAQQHAAQAAELRFKKAFEQVADNWFTLAEQAQWLEHYSRPQYGRPTPKEPAA